MPYIEIFGYVASAIVAFSLTRSDMLSLRSFNLLGSSSLCIYGFLIQAYPVAALNGFIAATNVIYLIKLQMAKNKDTKP